MTPPRCLAPVRPGILRFSGPDARRFLNGQVSQDVAGLGERCLPACVTDAKGRLQHFVHVLEGPDLDSLWVTCGADEVAPLEARLTRYLIADEVVVDDLSGEWTCIHAAADGELSSLMQRAREGVFGAGVDHWWRAGEEPAVEPVPADEAESLRIRAAIPARGRELAEGLLPPEAGLDRSAVSFTKGCYIGQEVISRIKSAGKLNRRLARLEVPDDAAAGDSLLLGEREVGRLTSVTPGPPREALAFLHKKAFDAGELQLTRDGQQKGPARRAGWA